MYQLPIEILRDVSETFYWNVLVSLILEGRPFLVVHHLPEIKEKGIPYLIPGIPITCRVDNTEKYTTRSKVDVVSVLHTYTYLVI